MAFALNEITSRANSRIKRFVQLTTNKKQRDTTKLFTVEGAVLCSELVFADWDVLELYLTQEAQKRYPKETTHLMAAAKEAFLVPSSLAHQMADTETTQGVFVVSRKKETMTQIPVKPTGKYLLLDRVQDPGNVGTILRTAFAFGIYGVWLSESADVFSPKVLRSTMGAAFHLPICQGEDLSKTIFELQQKKVEVWAAALTPTAKSVSEISFSKGSALMIGNEGSGLTEKRIKECTGAVKLPMVKGAESLNASVAASILLWEMAGRHQRED